MARSIIIPLIALVLSCGVLINGCATHSRLPSEGEERLIQQHSGVIVLLRLRTLVDGKPTESITLRERDHSNYGFGVAVTKLDPGQSPDKIEKRIDTGFISPSAGAKRQGWIYYVLPPGSYYLTVYDNMVRGDSLTPGFLLSVSGQNKMVYAGTLDIGCIMGHGFLFPVAFHASGVSLTDEGEAAKVLAQAHFAQYGPISTSLMSKYEKPVAVSQKPAIFPMGYITGAGTKDLGSPEWVKRGIKRGAALDSGTAEIAAGLMGVPGLNYAGALIGAAYVAYLPVGLIAGAIAGKSAERKWQPCIQELAQEIKENDPTAALQRKLGEELKKFPDSKTVALPPEGEAFKGSGPRELRSLLQVEVQRIQIRECSERGSFCVEVAIRARLWTIPGYSQYLDEVLVYTGTSLYERLPSEIQVPGSSPCRKMEAYCGPQGRQIFREEIDAAIPNLVEQLLTEVGLQFEGVS
jgi:hypothetical protein